MFSTTSVEAKPFPLLKKFMPMNKVKTDAQFGSFYDASHLIFFNFNQECQGAIKSFAMHSNIRSVDHFSVHNFDRVKFKNIFRDNLINIEPPVEDSTEKICGNFPCTGLKNIILKFKELVETDNVSTVVYANPPRNSFVKYSNTSLDNSESVNDMAYLKSQTSFVSIADPSNFKTNKICDKYYESNSFFCASNYQPAQLILENIEPEAITRALHPVYFTSKDFEFSNKLNSFADHKCLFGYESLQRLPRFPALIMVQNNTVNNYEIAFTSSNPNRLVLQLIDPDWKGLNKEVNYNKYALNIKLKYQSPQTVLVFKNLEEVKAEVFTPPGDINYINMNNTSDKVYCGKNKWNTVENLLDFYITNEPDCVLFLNVVNSIQLSLRYNVTISDFFSSTGPVDLMTKIAAVMGIDRSQVKIASIVPGSTIVNLEVLEKTPAAILAEDLNKQNINNSTTTDIFSITKVKAANDTGANTNATTNSTDDANKNKTDIIKTFTLNELANKLSIVISEGQFNLNYELLNSTVLINTARTDNSIPVIQNDTAGNNTDEAPVDVNPVNPSNNNPENNNTNNSTNGTGRATNSSKSIFESFWFYIYCALLLVVIIILLVIICVWLNRSSNINANRRGQLIKDENESSRNNMISDSFNIELENKQK